MIFEGKVVRFRLSPEGRVALEGLLERDSLQAFVGAADELGVWISLGKGEQNPTGSLMLLKWDYFSTAVVEVDLGPAPERMPAGFRP